MPGRSTTSCSSTSATRPPRRGAPRRCPGRSGWRPTSAAAVAGLHDDGFVRLELSGTNVLVDSRLLVTLIDTDSYLRTCSERAGVRPPALVTPDFAPPEVLGRKPGRAVVPVPGRLRTRCADFQPPRRHPPVPRQAPWGRAVGHLSTTRWPPASGRTTRPPPRRVRPSVHAAPREVLTTELWDLFHRCFVGGNRLPEVRPGARAWSAALGRAAAAEMWTCPECGRGVLRRAVRVPVVPARGTVGHRAVSRAVCDAPELEFALLVIHAGHREG